MHATNGHSKPNNVLTYFRQPQQPTSYINMIQNQNKQNIGKKNMQTLASLTWTMLINQHGHQRRAPQLQGQTKQLYSTNVRVRISL